MSASSDLNIQKHSAKSSFQVKIIRTEKCAPQGVPLRSQDVTVRSIYSRHTGEWKGFSGSSSREKGKEEDLSPAEPMQAKQVFVFKRRDGHPIYATGHHLAQAKAELTRRGYEIISSRNEVIQSEMLEALMEGEVVSVSKERASELIDRLVGYLDSQLEEIRDSRLQLDEMPTSERREKKIVKAERTLAKRQKRAKRQERMIKKEVKPVISEIADRLLESVRSLRELEQDSEVCPLSDLEANLSQDLETNIEKMRKGELGRKWKRIRAIIKYIESEKNAISGVVGCEKMYRELESISEGLSGYYSLMQNEGRRIDALYEEALSAKLALGVLQENQPDKQRKILAAEELSVRGTIAYVKSLEGECLSQVESNPVVQTLTKVIEFKKTHPEWHRNG